MLENDPHKELNWEFSLRIVRSMKIRNATPEDGAAVTRLLQSIEGLWQPEWRSDAVPRAIFAADGLSFVALEEDRVIGFICGHDVGFRAYLSELAVTEDRQRAGVGVALLRALESVLSVRGCRLVVADVYPPAEPFYRKQHWTAPAAVLLSRRLSL